MELFLQHYLIIYHKNYLHSGVPAATVTMATSALLQTLVQTNVCAITARLPIVYVPPSSICARPHLIFISPNLWPPNSLDRNPVDYRISGCLQDPCISEAHTRHQRPETAPGWWWSLVRLSTDSHRRAIDEGWKRLQGCVRTKGHHLEYVL